MLERKDIMGRFDKEGSQEYDSQIKKFIPGYKLLHQLSAAYLKTTLNTNAKILVVGAGTGSDILELAKIDPTWRFTALDISKEMLDTAKIRFTEADIIARINFHVGEIDTLTEKEYDVAVCLLADVLLPSTLRARDSRAVFTTSTGVSICPSPCLGKLEVMSPADSTDSRSLGMLFILTAESRL